MSDETPKKKSVWHFVFRAWSHWFHASYAAIVIATYFFWGVVDAYDHHEIKVIVAYVSLCVYVLLLLGLLLYALFEIRTLDRKARYANSVHSVRDAIRSLSDAQWYIGACYKSSTEVSRDALKAYLQPALDGVAKAFTICTGVHHRACIKVIDGNADRLLTRTLCRDYSSAVTNREKDSTEGDIHTIEGNTAFRLILGSTKRPYFLCQDIHSYPDYENTSVRQLGLRPPYKATLVVPIRHIPSAGTKDEIDALGFLGVDCEETNAYSEEYDIALACTFAEALFPVLHQWGTVQELVKSNPRTAVNAANVK